MLYRNLILTLLPEHLVPRSDDACGLRVLPPWLGVSTLFFVISSSVQFMSRSAFRVVCSRILLKLPSHMWVRDIIIIRAAHLQAAKAITLTL